MVQKETKTGEWKKLHNVELHNIYGNADIIRTFKSRGLLWAGHIARIEDGGEAHKLPVEKLKGKRLRGRLKIRWEDNIVCDL